MFSVADLQSLCNITPQYNIHCKYILKGVNSFLLEAKKLNGDRKKTFCGLLTEQILMG
jgi:hypothetical protein